MRFLSWIKIKVAKPVPALRLQVKLEVYKDKGGRWQWRLKDDMGNIIANCGSPFQSKQDCIDTAREICSGVCVFDENLPI